MGQDLSLHHSTQTLMHMNEVIMPDPLKMYYNLDLIIIKSELMVPFCCPSHAGLIAGYTDHPATEKVICFSVFLTWYS